MEERRAGERRETIDIEQLRDLLAEVIEEKSHNCVFNSDDTHDLRVLLDMYRETTSTMRKWFIRGFIILVFGGIVIFTAIKNGFMEGH